MGEFSVYSSLQTDSKVKFAAWPIRVGGHLALTYFRPDDPKWTIFIVLSSTAWAICKSSLWVLWVKVGQCQVAANSYRPGCKLDFWVRLYAAIDTAVSVQPCSKLRMSQKHQCGWVVSSCGIRNGEGSLGEFGVAPGNGEGVAAVGGGT